MHVTLDNSTLLLAQQEGVLTEREAFGLEALAETDGVVPDDLYDAVERLFLWCMDTDNNIH
jgi:hypothetical protein